MKTDSLTPIEQKVATFNVKNTIYIHPSQDAREVLEKRYEETLYGFSILGAEYLMSDLKMHGSEQKDLCGSENIVDLLVNNGNVWLSTSLFLTQWEGLILFTVSKSLTLIVTMRFVYVLVVRLSTTVRNVKCMKLLNNGRIQISLKW